MLTSKRIAAAAFTTILAASAMASPGLAIRPAEHSAPSVEDRHAAEADDKMLVQTLSSDASVQNMLSPSSYIWDTAPSTKVPLYPQSIVAPAGGGSTSQVDVKAIRTKQGMAFRLEWEDSTQDDGRKDSKFKDAAAIEFPVDSSGDTRLAMGHSGGPVNILYWSADTSTLRKGAGVQAEELVAAGIYNRARKEPKFQLLQCQTNWRGQKWAIVIFKPFNDADAASPKFEPGTDIPMAIAIWNGSAGERLGLKSLSNWGLLRVK